MSDSPLPTIMSLTRMRDWIICVWWRQLDRGASHAPARTRYLDELWVQWYSLDANGRPLSPVTTTQKLEEYAWETAPTTVTASDAACGELFVGRTWTFIVERTSAADTSGLYLYPTDLASAQAPRMTRPTRAAAHIPSTSLRDTNLHGIAKTGTHRRRILMIADDNGWEMGMSDGPEWNRPPAQWPSGAPAELTPNFLHSLPDALYSSRLRRACRGLAGDGRDNYWTVSDDRIVRAFSFAPDP